MIRSAREGMPEGAINIHSTAVVLDDGAVLITGRAGAGKTSLALALLESWKSGGRSSCLLADDQVFVDRDGAGRLVGYAPRATAGLAEIRGVGIVELPHRAAAAIELVVELDRDAPASDRLGNVSVAGVTLPLLRLPERGGARSVARVAVAVAAIRSARSPANAPIMVDPHDDLGLPTGEGRTT